MLSLSSVIHSLVPFQFHEVDGGSPQVIILESKIIVIDSETQDLVDVIKDGCKVFVPDGI